MAKFSDIENKFLQYICDDRLKTNLAEIRQAVEDIWSIDAPRIIKDYTDHGIKHCERLATIADKICNVGGNQILSELEIYLLLAGIYLHDIGMQCDIVRFPEIKELAIKNNANFDTDFTAESASNYSLIEQKNIRNNHQILSAAWIDYANISGKTVLGLAAKNISEELVDDLMDICIYHSKLPIFECKKNLNFDSNERKQLVAAILRFSDELDISEHRVSIETVKNYSINPSNSIFWWLHHRTKITFDRSNLIRISIKLHQQDSQRFGDFIRSFYISKFKEKNQDVLDILNENMIPITISKDSNIIELHRVEPFPPEIVHEIQTLQLEANETESKAQTSEKMQQFDLGTFEDYEIKYIDETDISWIYELDKLAFPEEDIVEKSVFENWFKKNKLIFTGLYRQNVLLGYYSMLPLTQDTLNKFITGTLREKDIRSDDILDEKAMFKSSKMYFFSIVMNRKFPRLTKELIFNAVETILDYKSKGKLEKIYATAASEEGEKLLIRFGFKRNNDGLERLDKHPLYIMDLNSDLNIMKIYRTDFRRFDMTFENL